MFDGLNVGKRNVTLNLKHPEAVELVRRLVVEWADAVAENFAPRAMRGFGLDYDALAANKPDLVMVSACLNGQTGPHRDYPGFGGQGSALAGYNLLTGWPDREPVGPHGTITDSLAPRFVATALAAGLLYRRRTGRGVYLDVSQVEAAIYTLAPWLLDYAVDDVIRLRDRERRRRRGAARRVPVRRRRRRRRPLGRDRLPRRRRVGRRSRASSASTIRRSAPSPPAPRARTMSKRSYGRGRRTGPAARSPTRLQAAGLEAVPVEDFGDLHEDPQLARRGHFVPHEHPVPRRRASTSATASGSPARESGYDRAGPTLGQDNDWVLGDLLGLDADAIAALRASGAVE